MELIKIVYRESDLKNTCYLTQYQEKIYGLNSNETQINIKFGSLCQHVNKVIMDRNEDLDTIYMSKDLISNILIPSNTLLQLKKADDFIELGPLIGVFINSKKVAALSEGKTDRVYECISSAANKLYGIVEFFSYGDIDWEKRLVKAKLWKNSQWISRILPLPTIIYDRCFGSYGRGISLKFRDMLGSGYKVVNSFPKLGKLETISALSKNSNLLGSIPETSIYHSSKDIERMLLRHPSVYLKPDALYKGKGVFRLSKIKDGGYKLEHRSDDKNDIVYIPTLDYIDDFINDYSILGGGYLIQQEIYKSSYHDYPFDFRLLYQKDWQGVWQPSGMSVRMGAPGSIITSPRSGGAVAKFKNVLQDTFNEDIYTENGIYKDVISTGREVVETIEREFGDCVELGLDMTIDINRKVWIIEVNGKPLKVSLKWLNDQSLMTRCYCRPLEYAVFLSGFTSADTESGGIML